MALSLPTWRRDKTAAKLVENAKLGESQVLLICARPSLEPEQVERLRVILERGVDWAYVLLAAHRQGMLPLLHARLSAAAPDIIPEGIAAQLRALFETNRRKMAASREELQASLEALDAAGVAALPLRMPALSRLYEDEAERQVEPYEVLVSPADLNRARDIVLGRGYRRVYPLKGRREAALLLSRPLPLHFDGRNVRMHLHPRTIPACYQVTLDDEGLKARARTISVGDGELRALLPDDLLLYTCVYGSLHMWGKLVWVADVARLLEDGEQLDWQQVITAARRAGVLRLLMLGLLVAKDLLNARVPDDVAALARNDAGLLGLIRRISDGFTTDLRGATSETERLRFRLALLEDRSERLRFGARFALTPAVDDLNAVRLPDLLTPAYRVVRPVRLGLSMASKLAGRVRRAPYFSTPMPLVERMLEIANVGPDDVVYDLGCGDGRTVITAAKLYGARGVGVDLEPQRIAESRANAREAGVAHLVEFIEGDATKADIAKATVVFLWLLPVLNLHMRPRLQAELPKGARVVSHSFDMGDWLPERTELVTYEDDQVSLVYLWTIGGRQEHLAGAEAPSEL